MLPPSEKSDTSSWFLFLHWPLVFETREIVSFRNLCNSNGFFLLICNTLNIRIHGVNSQKVTVIQRVFYLLLPATPLVLKGSYEVHPEQLNDRITARHHNAPEETVENE